VLRGVDAGAEGEGQAVAVKSGVLVIAFVAKEGCGARLEAFGCDLAALVPPLATPACPTLTQCFRHRHHPCPPFAFAPHSQHALRTAPAPALLPPASGGLKPAAAPPAPPAGALRTLLRVLGIWQLWGLALCNILKGA
jgi:hypothetical protein